MAEPDKIPKPSKEPQPQKPGHAPEQGKFGHGLEGGVDTGAIEPGRTGKPNPQ